MTTLDLLEPNIKDFLDPEEIKLALKFEYSNNYIKYQQALEYHRAFKLAKNAKETINEALTAFSNQEKSVTRAYGRVTIREILGEAGKELIVAAAILDDIAYQEAVAQMGRNLERQTFGKLKQQPQ